MACVIIAAVQSNWIEIAWMMMAAACLTLGAIHLLVWFRQRADLAHVAFFALATSVAIFSFFELSFVQARTPAEHAMWVRWAHVPITAIALLLIGFVRLYFGAGRLWLAGAAVGFRLLALLLNFVTGVNINFQDVTALEHETIWGGAVIAFPVGTLNPWQVVAQISNLLLVAFVIDASIALWRRGDAVSRRRAVLVGGSIVLCLLAVLGFAVLILSGTVRAPTVMTAGFLIVVVAMGYELSWDVVAAAQLAARLQTSEASLRASEERFRAVVEAAPSAILVMDSQGRITLANAQAESLFQHSRAVLVGSRFDRLVPERLRTAHAAWRRRYAESPVPRSLGLRRAVHLLRGDDSEVPVEVMLTPMRSEGEERVLVSIVDVTERRRYEREAATQRDEIAHLSRVAMLGELSGSLAHELNQPLAAILSNAQAAQRLLARSPPQLDTVADILADIVTSDRRAGAVIQRLRSLLRKEDVKHAPLDLNAVVQESLRLMHSDLLNRQVSVDTVYAPDLPAVAGDWVQLQQVLLNLLINGCDAMAGRRVAPHLVVTTGVADDGKLTISIADNGEGIPADDMQRIFDPFVTTKSHGIGLGLAICRSIIEAHGGRLWASNNADRGATFGIELPIQPAGGADVRA